MRDGLLCANAGQTDGVERREATTSATQRVMAT